MILITLFHVSLTGIDLHEIPILHRNYFFRVFDFFFFAFTGATGAPASTPIAW